MSKKLIFLHIEKAAGTALRKGFFFKNISKYRFWFGDSEEWSLDDSVFIGGHRMLDFYSSRGILNAIFTSVLREPVSRIISLYVYEKRIGVDFGINCEPTLDNVIKKSKYFREKIRNAQNRYISGQEIFSETLKIVNSGNYILGVQDDVESYQSFIAKALDFPVYQKVSANSARSVILPEVSSDVLSIIKELCSEDIKLYNFVFSSSERIYSTVSQAHLEEYKNVVDGFKNKKSIDVFKGGLYLSGSINCSERNSVFGLEVAVNNSSAGCWDNRKKNISFSYHWRQLNGDVEIYEGLRTQLDLEFCEPHSWVCSQMRVMAPEKPGFYILDLTMVKDGVTWFDDEGEFNNCRVIFEVI